MKKLLENNKRALLLKYEDMVNDFESFMNLIQNVLPVNKNTVNKMYNLSRPNKKESIGKHKRSGMVGEYKSKLEAETIEELNHKLSKILLDFNYPK